MKRQLIDKIAMTFYKRKKQFYLVGGTVRDELLHRPCKDIDAATDAKPDEIKAILAETMPLHIVPIGEKFGTIQAIYDDNEIIEITTYRGERYLQGSRKPTVEFGDSLLEDLRRRDFTVNAIAKDPIAEQYFDPFNGLLDIHNRTIRAVDNPVQRFIDDPLRMLRAARFVKQLSFFLDESTCDAIKAQAEHILDISQERIRDELNKMFLLENSSVDTYIRFLDTLGLLHYILPEVEQLKGVDQSPHHHFDVFNHTMMVFQSVSPRLELRWAALLHDIAKPKTRTVDDKGITHFYEHEDIGAEMAKDILSRLKFSNDFIERVAKMVKLHMRVNAYTEKWSIGAVRRLCLDAGDVFNDLLELAEEDGISDRNESITAVFDRIDSLRKRGQQVNIEAKQQPLQSPLNGNELMEIFNRKAGPWLALVKQHLQDLVIEGVLKSDDKQSAINAAKVFIGDNNG